MIFGIFSGKSDNLDNKYVISISGTQKIDDEISTQNVMTEAEYTEIDGNQIIKYKEFVSDDEEGDSVIDIEITIENGIITLQKGVAGSEGMMIFEKEKLHTSVYISEVLPITVNVFTHGICNEISVDGGRLEIEYVVDFDGTFETENHIVIILKKTEEKKDV